MKRKITIGVEDETDTQLLIDMLGMKLFNNLRKHFSGVEIRVPRHPSDDHPIVRKLGRADAELLGRDFGGTLLYVPKSGDRCSSRDRYIVNAIKAGVRRPDIAMSLDISQRHLRRLTERLGISGMVADTPGGAPRDVEAPRVETAAPLASYHQGVRAEAALRVHPSRNNLNPFQRMDLALSHADPATIRRWEMLIRLHLSKEITLEIAAARLGVSRSCLSSVVSRFRETGSIRPVVEPATAPHSNSNGGLTGLPAISRTPPRPAHENRASGR